MPIFGDNKARKAAPEPGTPAAPVATAAAPGDSLTGLLTNDELVDECRAAIEAANGGEQVGVLYLSFDGLRELNNKSGNLVTDHLLRELSKRLRATMRECDHAGRIANDEFVVILRQLNGKLPTLALLARLRVALAEPIASGKGTFVPIVNYGLAHPPGDGATLEALADAAEKAMLVMREQTRQAARDEAIKRVASTRAAVVTATKGIADAEQAVRDADNALADSKRRLVEAKAAVTAALEHAKALGVAEPA
jgi:diguanylate cyclase (GGDEF)-like protein